MGYGFSLFKNPSDHCNLTLGAMARARIQAMREQQGQDLVVIDPSTRSDLPMLGPTQDTKSNSSDAGVGWVRLTGHTQPHNTHVSSRSSHYIFSTNFLRQASLAFANTRERIVDPSNGDVDFVTTPLSRNKLHTMSAITMMLQKQQLDILVTNAELPAWPNNMRQFYAARYRRGQLFILRTVIRSIIVNLRQDLGLEPSRYRDKRVVRLDHVMKSGPKEFLQDFRAAIHVGLGTRNPDRIKRYNSVEVVLVLWLCGLWIWTSPIPDSGSETIMKEDLPAITADWIAFVRANYGDESHIGKQWTSTPPSEEGISIAESCHLIVKAAVAKNPRTLFNCYEANVHRLLWCLRVVREESFMCPSLEGEIGEAGDELMLFLEHGKGHDQSIGGTTLAAMAG
ncbi:MAG: hypothetical protein Q9170_007735 [Blastenia crenularia]